MAPFARRLRIVIPGGSGHIGRFLAVYLQQAGNDITVLTRLPYAAPYRTVFWDGERTDSHASESWIEALDGADVCINLAGRSVNCRFTPENRREVYASRIATTELLGRVLPNLEHPPGVWLNASTATIYQHSLDREMDENSGQIGGGELIAANRRAPEKWDFSVKVALDWEEALFEAFTPATRKVAMRTAIVMSPTPGGAFAQLLRLVRLSLGGTQGNGRQFVSWIHAIDFCRAVEFLIHRDDIAGAVNLAAPHPLPNWEFMSELREAAGMPNGIPAPRPLLELACLLLRTESELVLKSRRVVPARLLDADFEFLFPEWADAAEDLVHQWRERP